ncbi:hypothetical protein AK812_SmicGene2797 [Symbiodinium microadriaticum]|uniref:Uncharacterized protein n=1 Tax=Symbiodinium microadriaticum TaxID=2951 RepID=A0A1Q9F0L4_SYMMI|nr:hypothetical protein AK812_SmicGene2797 [Symbiodinium microadriaticum]
MSAPAFSSRALNMGVCYGVVPLHLRFAFTEVLDSEETETGDEEVPISNRQRRLTNKIAMASASIEAMSAWESGFLAEVALKILKGNPKKELQWTTPAIKIQRVHFGCEGAMGSLACLVRE